MKSRTKWIIGLGCLPIVGCGGCVAGLPGIVFGALRSSEPYEMSIAELNHNVQATDLPGTPIEGGWLVTGQISISNNDGSAKLSIPVSGPKGTGTADVETVLVRGTWSIDYLSLATGSERQILIVTEEGVILPESSAPDLPAEAPAAEDPDSKEKAPVNQSAKDASPIESTP